MKTRSKNYLFILLPAALTFCLVQALINSARLKSDDFMVEGSVVFSKRLDELNGNFKKGTADKVEWNTIQQETEKKLKVSKPVIAKPSIQTPEQIKKSKKGYGDYNIVDERLDLELVSVSHATQGKDKLGKTDVEYGNLQISPGYIDSLEVSIKGRESITNTSAEIQGNIFTFLEDGFEKTGMIFEENGG